MYLSYDVKGIQRFIFSVPRLKCVIGASELIAEFDRDSKATGVSWGGRCIFSGGGRGAFVCPNRDVAERLAEALITAAHKIGLDLRIGVAESLSDATQHANRLYPCVPEAPKGQAPLDGQPCRLSGLWPVPEGAGCGSAKDVHPLIEMRLRKASQDDLGTQLLRELADRGLIPDSLKGYTLAFFKTVTPDAEDGPDERQHAQAAQTALGKRNRWAVVALDGNDMGLQFLAFEKQRKTQGWSEDQARDWLTCMSAELEACTRESFLTALGSAIAGWAEEMGEEGLKKCLAREPRGESAMRLILPFRPLILGGDDVTLLCHSSYALSLVKHMAAEFSRLSRQAAEGARLAAPLWPATGGQLTVSAGILYAKVTFPLHMAIGYAEKLLGSAKGRYRNLHPADTPTPAAVDWDAITDTLVDTPPERRNRELRFVDDELGIKIQLTRRPYLLEPCSDLPDIGSLVELQNQLAAIPPSVRARILPALRRPWSERCEFLASVGKRHPLLMEQLWEGGDSPGPGWIPEGNGGERTLVTGLPDALLLLEEEHRMSRPTAAGR